MMTLPMATTIISSSHDDATDDDCIIICCFILLLSVLSNVCLSCGTIWGCWVGFLEEIGGPQREGRTATKILIICPQKPPKLQESKLQLSEPEARSSTIAAMVAAIPTFVSAHDYHPNDHSVLLIALIIVRCYRGVTESE